MAQVITSVRLDDREWQRALAVLGSRKASIGAMRAVNRTATNARAAMVPVVAREMGLSSSYVRSKISIQQARPSDDRPSAFLFATAKRTPLIEFKARGPYPSRGRGRGVTAKLPPPGAGRYPRAFIAIMSSGHKGVFERKGKARLPIRELMGPSVMHAFIKHGQVAQDRAAEMLTKNWEQQLKYLLEQAKQ